MEALGEIHQYTENETSKPWDNHSLWRITFIRGYNLRKRKRGSMGNAEGMARCSQNNILFQQWKGHQKRNDSLRLAGERVKYRSLRWLTEINALPIKGTLWSLWPLVVLLSNVLGSRFISIRRVPATGFMLFPRPAVGGGNVPRNWAMRHKGKEE